MLISRVKFQFLVITMIATFFSTFAQAEWSLIPRVYVEGQYDDNIFLTERNEEDDFVTTVSPGINLIYLAPTGEINLDYEFRRSFYSDFSELDFSEHRGRAEARKDFASWFGAEIREIFIRSEDPIEITGVTEFERPSVRRGRNRYTRNIVEPGATVQFGENRSIRLGYRNNILRNEVERIADLDENAGNALFTFGFNIRNVLEISYEYVNREYGSTFPPSSDRDHDGDDVSGRYRYYFNPKTSAFLEYRYYRRDFDTGSDYQVHNPNIGFTRDLYENLTLTASGGYIYRDSEDLENEDSFFGRGTLSGSYKLLTLSVYGEIGFYEDFTTAENLGFSEFWAAGLNGRYQLLETLWIDAFFYLQRDDFIDTNRRDTLWSARGRMSYQFLRWFFLSFEYEHNERNSNVPGEDYKNNRYFGRLTAEYDIAEFFK